MDEALAKEQIYERKFKQVQHPDYYQEGGIEVMDIIRAKMTPEMFQGYQLGNVIKYITRYRHKNGIVDLKKARNSLDYLIKELEYHDRRPLAEAQASDLKRVRNKVEVLCSDKRL